MSIANSSADLLFGNVVLTTLVTNLSHKTYFGGSVTSEVLFSVFCQNEYCYWKT